MRDNVYIWGIFHDGDIVEIIGSLPTISLRIEIEYLRNMFPSKGNSFLANISGCESIEFYDWDDETRTTNLINIQSKKPEIINVEQLDNVAHIICSTGELDILYKDIKFQLDSGESVTYKELENACKKYWDDWQSKSNS